MGILESVFAPDAPDTVNAPGVPLVDPDSAPAQSQQEAEAVQATRAANPWRDVLQGEYDKVAAAHPEQAQDRELAKLGAPRPRVRMPAAPGFEDKVVGYETHVDDKNGQIIEVPTYDKTSTATKVWHGVGKMLSLPFQAAGNFGELVATGANALAGKQTGPMDANEPGISLPEKLKRQRWNLEIEQKGTVPEQVGQTSENVAVATAAAAEGGAAMSRAAALETGGMATRAAVQGADSAFNGVRALPAGPGWRAIGGAVNPAAVDAGEAAAGAARAQMGTRGADEAARLGAIAAQVPPMLMPAKYRDPTTPPPAGFWNQMEDFWTDPENLGAISGLVPMAAHGAGEVRRQVGDLRNMMDAFSRNAPPDHDVRVTGSTPNPSGPAGPGLHVGEDLLTGGPSGPGPKLLGDTYQDMRQQAPVTSEENLFQQAPVAYASWQQVKDAMTRGDPASVLSRLGVFMDDLKKAGLTEEANRFADAVSQRWDGYVPTSTRPDVGQTPPVSALTKGELAKGSQPGFAPRPTAGGMAPNWPARPPAARPDTPPMQGPPARLAQDTPAGAVKSAVDAFRAAAEAVERRKAEGPARSWMQKVDDAAAARAQEAKDAAEADAAKAEAEKVANPKNADLTAALRKSGMSRAGGTWTPPDTRAEPGERGIVEPGTWAMPDEGEGGEPPASPPPAPPSPPSAPPAPPAGPRAPTNPPAPPSAPPPQSRPAPPAATPPASAGAPVPRPSAPPAATLPWKPTHRVTELEEEARGEGWDVNPPTKPAARPPLGVMAADAPQQDAITPVADKKPTKAAIIPTRNGIMVQPLDDDGNPVGQPHPANEPPAERPASERPVKQKPSTDPRLTTPAPTIDKEGLLKHLREELAKLDRDLVSTPPDAPQLEGIKRARDNVQRRIAALEPKPPTPQLPPPIAGIGLPTFVGAPHVPKPAPAPARPPVTPEAPPPAKTPVAAPTNPFDKTQAAPSGYEHAERFQKLIDRFVGHVQKDTLPKRPDELRKLAADLYPGGDVGDFTDEVHDAVETALNAEFLRVAQGFGGARSPAAALRDARALETLLGSRSRTLGMGDKQQFSTPLPIAVMAAAAAHLRPADVVLEPTAGTGNLAVAAKVLSPLATIMTNELDPRRREALKTLGFKPAGGYYGPQPVKDAKPYDPPEAPSVVIANYPWGTFASGKRGSAFGTKFTPGDLAETYFPQSMRELQDGGRLVAVNPTTSIDPKGKEFLDWLRKEYTLRAVIESPDGSYKTRGTDVGSVLIVADKRKPVESDPAPVWATGDAKPKTWQDFADLVGRIAPRAEPAPRADTPAPVPVKTGKPPEAKLPWGGSKTHEPPEATADQPGSAPPAGSPAPAGDRAPAAGPGAGGGAASDRGGNAGTPGLGVRPPGAPGREGEGGHPGVGSGEPRPEGAGVGAGLVPEAGPAEPGEADVAAGEGGAVSGSSREITAARLGELRRQQRAALSKSELFVPSPLRSGLAGAAHPTPVVMTRSLAGTPRAAELTYKVGPILADLVRNGTDKSNGLPIISEDQAAGIVFVCQANVNGHAALVADGVGVGKSREAAGVAIEWLTTHQAQKLCVVTKSAQNVQDLMKEFRLTFSGEITGAFPARLVDLQEEFPNTSGRRAEKREPYVPSNGPEVLFVSSGNLTSYESSLKEAGIDALIGDECHTYKNDLAMLGKAWGSIHRYLYERAPAGQRRIAYFSATPGSDLSDLGYLYGLGLWTPAPGHFNDWLRYMKGENPNFDANVASGLPTSSDDEDDDDVQQDGAPVAAGGGDSDAGSGTARPRGRAGFGKSAKNVYDPTVQNDMLEQIMRELYHAGRFIARDLWRGGLEVATKKIEMTPANEGRWAAFSDLAVRAQDLCRATAKLNPKQKSPLGSIRAQLLFAAKRLLFDFRIDAGIAAAKDAIKRGERPIVFLDYVSEVEEGAGNLTAAVQLINHIQVDENPETGETIFEGANRDALNAKYELLDLVNKIGEQRDPIETFQKAFGKDRCAIITGDVVSPEKRDVIRREFQEGGKKDVAVLSGAGKTGVSFHDIATADKPLGTGRRHMIFLDYDFSVVNVYQAMGRGDRAGQMSPPKITFLHLGQASERRFLSSIVARLRGLGAAAKGDAGSVDASDSLGEFDVNAAVARHALADAWSSKTHDKEGFPEPTGPWKLDDEEKESFTGDAWFQGRDRTPKATVGRSAKMLKLLMNDLLFMPLDVAGNIYAKVMERREELESGQSEAQRQAGNTRRLSGAVVATHELTKELQLLEVKPQGMAHNFGLLTGMITPEFKKLDDAYRRSRPSDTLDERTAALSDTRLPRVFKSIRTPSGQVTGMEVPSSALNTIKSTYAIKLKMPETPQEIWSHVIDLRGKVLVRGADGKPWTLKSYRPKDALASDPPMLRVDGATMAHQGALRPVCAHYGAGNAWVVRNVEQLPKFLERFPMDRPATEATLKLGSAGESGKANVSLLTATAVGAAIGMGVGGPAGAAIGAIAGPATYAAASHALETLSGVPEYIHDAMPEVYGKVAAAWSNMKELATHHPDLKAYDLEPGVNVEQRVAIDDDRSNAIGIIQEKAIKAGIAAIEPSVNDLHIATEIIVGLDERGSFVDAAARGAPDPVVPSGRNLGMIERDLRDLNDDAKMRGTPAKVKALVNLYRALDDEAFQWQVDAGHLRPESKKTGHVFRMSQARAQKEEAERISGEKSGPPPATPGGMVPAKEKPAWSSKSRSNAKVYERVNPWQSLLVQRIQAHKAVLNHEFAVDVSAKFGTPAATVAARIAAGGTGLEPGEALYSFDPRAPTMDEKNGPAFLSAWHQTVTDLVNNLAAVYGGGAAGRARALAHPQIAKALSQIGGKMPMRGHFNMGGFVYAVLPEGLAKGLQKARETMPKALTWLSSLVTWGSRAVQAGMIVYAPSYWVGQATLHAHTHFAIPPTKWLKLAVEMAKGIGKSLRAEFRESALGGHQVDPYYDEARRRGLQSPGIAEAPISGEVSSHNYLPFNLKSGKQKAATVASLLNPFGEHGAANRILQGLGRVRETGYRMGHARVIEGAQLPGALGALTGGMGATPARAAIRANERGIWYTRRGLFARKVATPMLAFTKAAVEVFLNNTKRAGSDPVTGKGSVRGLVSTWAPIAAVAGAQFIWNHQNADVASQIPARYQDDLHVAAMVDTPQGKRLRVTMIPTNAGEFFDECKAGAAAGKWLYHVVMGESTTGDIAPMREFVFGHLGPHIREPLERAADENLATGADLTPDRYKGLSDEAQRELHEKEGGRHKTPREDYFERNYSPGPLALVRRIQRAEEDKSLSEADRTRLEFGLREYDMNPKAKELEEQREQGPRLFEGAFDQWRAGDKEGFAKSTAEIERLGMQVAWMAFLKEHLKAFIRAPSHTPQRMEDIRAARIPGQPQK